MNKFVFAFASLLAVTALACGGSESSESAEEETQEVKAEVESSVDVNACRQMFLCTTNSRYYTSSTTCRAACGTGRCFNEGYCCSNGCVWR